jgi:CRP-like cAMP-binding protein
LLEQRYPATAVVTSETAEFYRFSREFFEKVIGNNIYEKLHPIFLFKLF